MKVIGCWLRKGGTGKTTTAGNIADRLRERGQVLLVDLDSQANLTSWLLTEAWRYEAADVLSGERELLTSAKPLYPGLDLLPSFAIDGTLRTWAETRLTSQPYAFADFREAAERAGYDFVVIDFAPADSQLERQALAICDDLILVTQPEYFGADGIEAAEDTLAAVKRDYRGRIQSVQLVINRINRSYAAHKALVEHLEGHGYRVHLIGQSTDVHDAVMQHIPLYSYYSGHKAVHTYREIAEGIYGRPA